MDRTARLMEAARHDARALTVVRPAFACFGNDAQYCQVVSASFQENQSYTDLIAQLPPCARWFAYTTVSPPLFPLLAALEIEGASAEQLLTRLPRWEDNYAELLNKVETTARSLHGWDENFDVVICKRATSASQLALDIASGGDYEQWGFVTFAEGVFALGMMRRLIGRRSDVIHFSGDVTQQLNESLVALAKNFNSRRIMFQVPVITELGRLIEPALVSTVKNVLEDSIKQKVIDHYVIVMDGPQASNRQLSVFSDKSYPVDFWISTTGKAGLSPWNTSLLAFRPDQIAARGFLHEVPIWLPSVTELIAMRTALSMWVTNDSARLKYWSTLSAEFAAPLAARLGDRIHIETGADGHPGIVLIRATGENSKMLTNRLRKRLVFEFQIPVGTVGVRRDHDGAAQHFVRIGLPPPTLMLPTPDFEALADAIHTALCSS